MCYYVEITLPASADIAAARRIMRRFGRDLELIQPLPDADWLPAGHDCYETYAGHCDCGTALGSLEKAEERLRKVQAEADGLRRKGWSPAKVAR